MSTTQNKGNQQLTFDYKLPAKGRNFNRLLFSIIKPGIYQGLEVTIDTGNKINIGSGFAFLNCVFESELVRGSLARFQTAVVSESIPQSTPGQNEVVYLLFEYKEVIENWVGIFHAQSGSTLPSEAVILCDLVYDIDGNITNVIYSNRLFGSLNQDYNIPDTNRFANSLDRTRQGRFDLSRVSGGQNRSIRFPDYDFDLSTLDDWITARNYNLKEVVVYNKTLYRCITAHTSSSFFTDLSNWENITQIQDEEKTRGFNDSGSTIASGLIVTISGDSPSEEIPEISPISLYSQEPYGIAISSILNGESGEVIQRGRLVVTSFDSSLGIIGQKVYSDSSGNLTLSITPLVVGQLITPSVSNSVIYVGILPTEEGINPINFNGQLSSTEDTIQKVLDRLDDYGYAPDWETSKNYRVGNLVVRIDDSSNSLWQCILAHSSTVFTSDISNWKPIKVDSIGDITSLDSNLSVTGGIGSTLKNVEIQLNQNPELNSINVNEINLTGYNLISSSGVSGLSNNVDVSNIGVLKFDQPTTITGFQKPGINKFKLLTVTNISSGDVILADESSNSDLENRIITGLSKDLTLKPDSSINLYYDFSSLIWRIIGGTGSGSSGGGSDGLIYSPSVLTPNLKPNQYNDWNLLLPELSNLALPKIYFTETCTIPCGDYYNYEFISATKQNILSFGANLITITFSGLPVNNMIPKYLERIDLNLAAISGSANLDHSYYSFVESKIRTTTYTLNLNFTISASINMRTSNITSSAVGTSAVFFGGSGININFSIDGDCYMKDGILSDFDNITLYLNSSAKDSTRVDEQIFPVIGSVTKGVFTLDPMIYYAPSTSKIKKFYEIVDVAKTTFTLPIKGTNDSVIVFVDGYPQNQNFNVIGTDLIFTSTVSPGSVVNGWVINI
jgi:hypothetical protein